MTAPKVRMRHSKTEGEFDAPQAAVDTYRRAGWVPVDEITDEATQEPASEPTAPGPGLQVDKAAKPATGQEDAADAVPDTNEVKTPSRRRATMKEES